MRTDFTDYQMIAYAIEDKEEWYQDKMDCEEYTEFLSGNYAQSLDDTEFADYLNQEGGGTY